MWIIPAIDLRGGRVVRLTKGSFDAETVYSESPADVMAKWQKEGAKLVHVVDLDGARDGQRKNLGSLKNILTVAKVPVQFGGGLRSYEAVCEILNAGIWRAVVGTKAFDDVLIEKLAKEFKDRIAVGLDVKGGVIQTQGWLRGESDYQLEDFCRHLKEIGIRTIIFTDVARDGTLEGPNFEILDHLLQATALDIILSGGVSGLEDLAKLARIKAKNFKGVIVGKALYEQKFLLRDAVMQFQSDST